MAFLGQQSIPAAVHDLQFAGQGLSFSPYEPGRLAVATAANFGIVGNGRLVVVLVVSAPGGGLALQPLGLFETNDGLYDVAWSEAHEHQLVAASGDGSVKLFDVVAPTGGRPVAVFCEHQAEVAGIDWNLVEKDAFASCSWDHTIKVWRPERPASVLTLAEHSYCVYEARWAPRHPSRLLSASGDRTVKLWDPKAGAQSVLTVGASDAEVLSVDWSKYDEHSFATAAVDRRAATWDLRFPAAPTSVLAAHGSAVRRVRCGPHHPTALLTGGYDMSVCVWDAAAPPHPQRQFAHHTEFVVGCEWSLFQEGVVASCGWDNMLHVWHRDAQPLAPPPPVRALPAPG